MALSTTRKFSIGLFAVTTIAVVFAGIAYLSVNEISSSAGWVTHTNQVLLSLENLGADLSAAESGERGYLLTAKPEYLEPYYAVRDVIPRRLAELRRLTVDNPRQHASLDTLAQVVPERMGVIQAVLDSAEKNGAEAGAAVISAGRGKALMAVARRLLNKMTAEERGLLEERLQKERMVVQRTTNIVAVGLGLTVLLCAVGAITIITDHDARSRATAEMLRLRHEAELAAARSQQEAARADEERQRAEEEAIKAGDAAAEAEQSAQEAATAMEDLARSEREIREFFENATVGLHWADGNGTIQRVNRAELEMLGYSWTEYVGRHVADFHVERGIMEDVLRRVRAREVVENRESRVRCKDGSIKHVLLDCSGYWDRDQFVHTRCFTRDITERKLVEERLRQVERIESVGRLAGGVAHEVNNQISVVLGAADFLLRRDDLPAAARRRRGADPEGGGAVRRGDGPAPRLQPAADPSAGGPRPQQGDLGVRAGAPARRRRALCAHAPSRAESPAHPGRPGAARAGSAQSRAQRRRCDADGRQPHDRDEHRGADGGVSPPEAGNRHPGGAARGDAGVRYRPRDPQGPAGEDLRSLLHHQADRAGHRARPLHRVRDREAVGGVHLGIQRGGGRDRVQGLSPGGRCPGPAAGGAPTPPRRKSDETILVVEDEPAVREMIVRILSAEGYVVLEAQNGQDALTVFQGNSKPIALVLTDVAMPEMGGQELGLRLAKLAPTLRVIYMSGFTDEEVVRRGLLQRDVPIVQKPLLPESLTRRIRAILDGQEA